MNPKRRDIPKKTISKQSKAIRYIQDDTNLKVGTEATKNIVVCNAGLALGLSQEDVITTFSRFGAIESVVLLPNKTYCFLTFADLSSAQDAYFHLHGKGTLPKCNHVLVLAFAESVPDVLSFWPTIPSDFPPGLIVLEDFVSCEEEEKLIKCMEWENSNGSNLKHRQVQHFGYEFRYGSNDVDTEAPLEKSIPKECDSILSRFERYSSDGKKFCPDQLTVNRYLPGQGIPSHVDTHSAFDDPILSLSLLSDVVMEFRDAHGKKIPVLLPRRSLTIMSSESRYGWTHGITPRSHDIVQSKHKQGLTILPRSERISFTFRKLNANRNCSCAYPTFCDSQKNSLLKNRTAAISLEKKFVQEVYDEITNHFSATRHKAWPFVFDFCKTFKTGDVLVDVGCGNGKYFGHHPDNNVFEVGLDACVGLTNLCAEKGFQVLNGNCVNLPFQSGVADGCLCIAVIHHLSTHERRRQAVQEISRVLRKGGRALVYVWARDQCRKHVRSSYLKGNREDQLTFIAHQEDPCKSFETCRETVSQETVSEKEGNDSVSVNSGNNVNSKKKSGSSEVIDEFLPLPVHINRTNFQHSDVLVPWKLRKKDDGNENDTFLRYYHLFEEGELELLCSEVPEVQVVESKYDQGNWVVLLRKIS